MIWFSVVLRFSEAVKGSKFCWSSGMLAAESGGRALFTRRSRARRLSACVAGVSGSRETCWQRSTAAMKLQTPSSKPRSPTRTLLPSRLNRTLMIRTTRSGLWETLLAPFIVILPHKDDGSMLYIHTCDTVR